MSHADRSAAATDCSKAAATRLLSQFGVNNFGVSDPVVQVLCGEFTGPGSTAMALEIGNAPTCWGVQRWEVFSFTGGAWQLTLDREEFVSGSLVAVGSDIRVTTPVFIKGDSRCTLRYREAVVDGDNVRLREIEGPADEVERLLRERGATMKVPPLTPRLPNADP